MQKVRPRCDQPSDRGQIEQTTELPRERDNARNNVRCTQAKKTTLGQDGLHQDMYRTPCRRVKLNDRMNKARPWCGQP